MSLKREVGFGLFWMAIATLASKALSLMRKLILARLLVPEDFGLVAYASLAIGVLELFKEMGFSSALIYRKDDVEEAANTTFIAVILSSVILYIVSFAAAPHLASFFRSDGLTSVLRVLALSLVLSAVSQVPTTLMAKGMGFKNKVIPEIIAGVFGAGISIVLAFTGYGVWSIVYGQLITSLVLAVLVWFFCPWRPTLRLSKRVAAELWDYGRHIVGSQILVFFITNIDDVFIGRLKGDADLGTYGLAYELSNLPATHLSRIVGRVMFPAFSKVQCDLRRLQQVFFHSLKYVSLLAFPIAIISMVFAQDFIVVAYGKKWFQAVVPLQLLAIYGLARAIAVNMGNVFKAGGKPKWLLYIASWRLVTMAALLYPAIRWRGIIGVSALSAVVSVIDFGISMYLTNRVIHAPWRRYAQILLPMLVSATVTALFGHRLYVWINGYMHPFVSLPLTGGIALGLYGLSMYAYDAEIRQVIQEVITGLRREVSRLKVARAHTDA